MTAIYLLIVFIPLAPAAMHSKSIAHALTGACSGDCSICGCSAESSANHTCCCAKKHLQEQAHEDDEDTPVCCRKKQSQITIVRCGCPCGDRKQIAFTGSGTFELLPFEFSERVVRPQELTRYPHISHRLASRHGEPPDPPPRLPLIS